jgi:hypothetical protein
MADSRVGRSGGREVDVVTVALVIHIDRDAAARVYGNFGLDEYICKQVAQSEAAEEGVIVDAYTRS